MLRNNLQWKILGGGEILIPKEENKFGFKSWSETVLNEKNRKQKNTSVRTSPGIKTVPRMRIHRPDLLL